MSGPNFTAEEAAAIGTNYPQSTRGLQRISHRARPVPLIISPPTPLWAEQYETLRSRIESALAPATITTTSHDGDGDQRPRGETKPFLLSVAHVGSTSVPGLPAKAVIDVDVVVADPADEASYVGRLVGDGWEATGTGRGGGAGAGRPAGAGLQFMLREPAWHGHRFFVCEDPPANVHVFGPGCPETVRHRIFRDWLVEHPQDRELYVQAKRSASAASLEAGDDMSAYNLRKEPVVRQILDRALRAHGLLK